MMVEGTSTSLQHTVLSCMHLTCCHQEHDQQEVVENLREQGTGPQLTGDSFFVFSPTNRFRYADLVSSIVVALWLTLTQIGCGGNYLPPGRRIHLAVPCAGQLRVPCNGELVRWR